MALHEHERDLLEDTMYQRLVDLWSEFSDDISVFVANTADQQLYAIKVWEALLADSPSSTNTCTQTVLLAREMAHMMKWDGDSKHAVNIHFGKVNETRQALGYLDYLTLANVLKSVLMATLKASANRTLRDAYHNILDDLDDDKELTLVVNTGPFFKFLLHNHSVIYKIIIFFFRRSKRQRKF